jgi:hypothetical protein
LAVFVLEIEMENKESGSIKQQVPWRRLWDILHRKEAEVEKQAVA